MPDNFAQRLEKLVHELNVEKQSFATAGNVSKATFSGYLKGKQHPNRQTLSNWIRKYGINANWLMVGEGPMFRDEQSKAPGDSLTPKTQTGQELMEIKLILQDAEVSKEDIKQALLDYVSGGRAPQDSATGTDNDSG